MLKIADVAAKEYSLEEALMEMKQEWADIILDIKEYKKTNTYVLFGAAELQEVGYVFTTNTSDVFLSF